MKRKNRRKAWVIFGIYFAATIALIFGCYSVQKPEIQREEFRCLRGRICPGAEIHR